MYPFNYLTEKQAIKHQEDPFFRKRSMPRIKIAPRASTISGQISDQMFEFEKFKKASILFFGRRFACRNLFQWSG